LQHKGKDRECCRQHLEVSATTGAGLPETASFLRSAGDPVIGNNLSSRVAALTVRGIFTGQYHHSFPPKIGLARVMAVNQLLTWKAPDDHRVERDCNFAVAKRPSSAASVANPRRREHPVCSSQLGVCPSQLGRLRSGGRLVASFIAHLVRL
jgi:hypothetical protein